MRPQKLSNRLVVSAILVIAGIVLSATAFFSVTVFFLPRAVEELAVALFFVGIMLIGAGVLCPFRRTIYGTVGGFLFAVYLTTPVVRFDGDASTTFKNVAKELGDESPVDTEAGLPR